jgi:tetratricopeptide (TPR) repeat protein
MFLVDKTLQKTKLTLSLLALLHSAALQAQLKVKQEEPQQSESQVPDTGLAQHSSADIATLQDLPGISIAWPLLPGESVTSLAALFYPHNKNMQQRFVSKTVQLNKPINPALDPAAKVNLVTLIMVPDIKALGKNSGKIHVHTIRHSKTPRASSLQLSYQLKDAAQFIVTPKMQAEYDSLVAKNARLKAELEALNAKLAQLQQILAALKEQASQVLKRNESSPSAAAQTPVARTKVAQPQVQTQVAQIKSVTVLKSVEPQLMPAKPETASTADSFKLWVLCLTLLAGVALILGWRSYNRRQEKELYLAATGEFDPLKTGIFNQAGGNQASDLAAPVVNLNKVDFSLTQNGLNDFGSNISVVDLSNVEGLEALEEGDLIMEQARIYINIGRVDEAIDLLKAQIKTVPKESLHHWLYLLDIYRDHDRQQEFMQYAKQLHETFNVMLPLWGNATAPIVTASSLEEFPHIVHSLTGLWADSAKDAKAYIDELIMDNRQSERAGFSMEVFQELVLLRDLLTARERIANTV